MQEQREGYSTHGILTYTCTCACVFIIGMSHTHGEDVIAANCRLIGHQGSTHTARYWPRVSVSLISRLKTSCSRGGTTPKIRRPMYLLTMEAHVSYDTAF